MPQVPILLLKANILTVITLLKLFLCVHKLCLSIFLLQYREIFNLMALGMKPQQQAGPERRDGTRHQIYQNKISISF